MRPLDRPPEFSAFFTRVVLYLDDLEEIELLLRRDGLRVRWSDGAMEYESLEEVIKTRGERPVALFLDAFDPADFSDSPRPLLSLSIIKQVIYLTGRRSDDNPLIYELMYELRSLLSDRTSRLIRFTGSGSALASEFAVLLGAIMIAFFIPGLPDIVPISLMSGGVTTLILIQIMGVWHPRILLQRRHVGGFFRRNRDDLIKGSIGAVVGTVIGVGLTELVHWMGR